LQRGARISGGDGGRRKQRREIRREACSAERLGTASWGCGSRDRPASAMGRSLAYGHAATGCTLDSRALPPRWWDSVHVLRGELQDVNWAGIKVLAEVLS